MNNSFFDARGVVFQIHIPFEEITKIANSKIVSQKDSKFIHFESYSDFYFPIEFETKSEGSILSKKQEYFLKSIFIQDEFNHFEREAMFQFVYSLIRNTDYKFNIVIGGFLADYDYNYYGFQDIKSNMHLD